MTPSGGVSFVDVRDASNAVLGALLLGHPNRRYLLAGANWTFADFYARAARIAGVREPLARAPKLARRLLGLFPAKQTHRLPAEPIELQMASHFWWADATRARTELNWTAREPMETLAEAVSASR